MDAVTARHQAFRALLEALAMPGTRHPLAGSEPLALILDAVYSDVESALQSGAIAIAASELHSEAVANARRGSEVEPEGGATLFLQIDERTPWTPATICGPGIRGSMQLDVPFSTETVQARRRACAAFPCGVDIVAIDRDGAVFAFPRTTRMELS